MFVMEGDIVVVTDGYMCHGRVNMSHRRQIRVCHERRIHVMKWGFVPSKANFIGKAILVAVDGQYVLMELQMICEPIGD